MANVVVVAIEYVDNECGLWCLDCNLSTGCRVWFTTSTDQDADTTLRAAVFCPECEGRRVVDNDEPCD